MLVSRKNCEREERKTYRSLWLLRRIVTWDEVGEREIVILFNNLELVASTIAEIYKQRWQIEIFFKALKQNFKVKAFVGPPSNLNFRRQAKRKSA